MHRLFRRTSLIAAYLLLLQLIVSAAVPQAGNMVAYAAPITVSGFQDQLLASGTGSTGLAFTPDGRIVFTTKNGKIRIYKNDVLLPTAALDISSKICTEIERGLLGVAVDPDFATNNYIYVYYTFKRFPNASAPCPTRDAGSPVNRVVRFVLPTSNIIDPASETVLVDNIPTPSGGHNGGDLQFGKDGYLYFTVGDGQYDYAKDSGDTGANDAARDLSALVGKIGRITRDGGIPPGNPFQGQGTASCNQGPVAHPLKCQEIFAYGLRNPFRFAFDPNTNGTTTRFFINDVGLAKWEEVNEGSVGADYGWNVREGACVRNTYDNCGPQPAGMINPIYAYRHDTDYNSYDDTATSTGTKCVSITAGAFVPKGIWPAEFDGAYLFGDYGCYTIFMLKQSGGGVTSVPFAWGAGSVGLITAMKFGPYQSTQALYYITYAGNLRRITYVGGGNRTPSAVIGANPGAEGGVIEGPSPLTVSFNATGSSDPDGDLLSYQWDFGNGATSTKATPPPQIYAAGQYQVTLRVDDKKGGTSTASVFVDAGNSRPEPRIDSPTSDARFAVGEQITLHGSATDADGDPVTLTWELRLHHDSHFHPFRPPTTGDTLSFTAPEPESLPAANTSYLEILLTASDGKSTKQISQNFYPKRVIITVDAAPAGTAVFLNEEPYTTPQAILSWEGYQFGVRAALHAGENDMLTFSGWSDGVTDIQRPFVTPASPITLTAQYSTSPTPNQAPAYRVLLPYTRK